ncbi:MAG: CHAT domain-containing protein, partial [Coleofasciculus sp. S288]|nr:CHAT domain-containing protein [Coleofasciculus sp. S288]
WVIKPTGEIEFRRSNPESSHTSLEELIADANPSMMDGGRGQTQDVPFQPGDWVRLNDDAPGYDPWEVVTVDFAAQKLTLRQRSFAEGVIITRSFTDATKEQSSRAKKPHLTELHELLIAPISDLLPTNPQAPVVFVPQQELFLVPFPALQDREGKYLIEKHTILTTPAIRVLQSTYQRRHQLSGEAQAQQVLVVGNPNPMPEGFKPLPYSENEAVDIARLLNTTPLIGKDATEPAIERQLSNARLIHLATHGQFDDRVPLKGAIALAPAGEKYDGLLTAEEIMQYRLNAELVVLSACNTGRGQITGDGVIGLTRTLIAAGVPSVIVSLWSVPDESTTTLMIEFYRNYVQNPDKAQALRQAMLTTMESFPDPENWAAFTLVGSP